MQYYIHILQSFYSADNEKPFFINLPANITNSTDSGLANTTVSWVEPTVTDNSGVVSLSSSHSPGTVFSIGSTEVTYTAIDNTGNVAYGSFTVTVEGKLKKGLLY